MHQARYFFLPLSTLLCAACTTDSDVQPAEADARLYGQMWLNSYEAREEQTPIYRPQGYTWATPPVRYRVPFEGGDGFRFEQNGTLLYQAPGIGPGPTLHAGTWWRDTPDPTVFRVHLTDNYRPDFQVQIVSVDTDILRARYVP